MSHKKIAKPGSKVVLISIPPGLLKDLPGSDKRAIQSIVGRPVLLRQYDELGRAELEFVDSEDGSFHVIYVSPTYIRSSTDEA
jgi:hypothetical protein